MTIQNTSLVDNDLSNSFKRRNASRYTTGEQRAPHSPFVPTIPAATAGTDNSLQKSLLHGRQTPASEGNHVLQQRVAGVVSEVRLETIVIQCQLSSQLVEINLPPALVPPELQAFGQTVSLSLDYSMGYQRPVVERRSAAPHEMLPGEAEADAWIAAL